MAARRMDLVGVLPVASKTILWQGMPPVLQRAEPSWEPLSTPSCPLHPQQGRGGAEGAVHKGAWAARKAPCPPALT